MAAIDDTEALISETDVLTRWPALSRSALLAARKAGSIAWVRGKRGSAWYRPAAVETFITKELEQPCRDHAREISLNSAANGSPKNPEGPGGTDSGMTPAMEEHVALACAQTILKPRKAASRKSL